MFVVDDIKGGGLATVVVGAVAILLAPVVVPAVAQAARPLLKEAIKGGMLCFQKGREAMAEVGEMFEDIVAEARAEVESGRAQPAAETAEGGAGKAPGAGEPSPEVVG